MSKLWVYFAATVCAFALPACEDNPDQIYKKAPPGAQNRWNDGKTPPVWDPARNGFFDSFNSTTKQELCPGPVKQKKWAQMINEPVIPPVKIAGLDLSGGP